MGDEYAVKAAYGNTTIKGHDLEGVADALIERGFDMSKATPLDDGALSVPHTLPRRRPAKLWMELPEPEPVEPDEVTLRLHAAYTAVCSGTVKPGIQTRPCGAVHSDGVVCLIPVLFEALHCGCGDMVFPHEQPHEAVDETGVRYRWVEVLMIQDLEYDTYSMSGGEQASA